jgi:DNA-directed RNA polymerase specialized sigma24 family protein
LSRRQLQCIVLRINGYSYAEIGRALGIQVGTVSAMISRATQKLRPMLVRECD